MEPKAPKKAYKRINKSFTNIFKQTEPQAQLLSGYNTIAAVHSKFSSLVISETVYSLQYSHKTGSNSK